MVINPFDFSQKQMLSSRKVFLPPKKKGFVLKQDKHDNKASIEKLFQDIYKYIPKLSQDKWRNILKELDQAPYDHVNVSSNLTDLLSTNKNLGISLDLNLLSSKVLF